MTEPRATSFHGDLARVSNPARAAPGDEDDAPALRETKRIVGEVRRRGVGLCRVGPKVLSLRSMETVKAPKVVEK